MLSRRDHQCYVNEHCRYSVGAGGGEEKGVGEWRGKRGGGGGRKGEESRPDWYGHTCAIVL